VWLPAPCEWLPSELPLSLLLELLSEDFFSEDEEEDDDESEESELEESLLLDLLPFDGLLPDPEP
jgi:hypothetical protein